jgi:cytochrome c oxidase subunit 2
MSNIIIGIGVLLLLIILGMILRVQTLISVVRGPVNQRGGTSNKVNAALMLVFLVVGSIAAVWVSFASADQFLPEAVSEQGKQIDFLFWLTMGILCAVFFVTHLLLFYFPYKYQFKESRKATFYPDNNRLEVLWTVVPAIVLTILVLSGWKAWQQITSKAPESAVVVEIVGKQFNWLVRYPGSKQKEIGTPRAELGAYDFRLIDAENELGIDFTDENSIDDFLPREIHIPKGRAVLFKIRARDVLHSVFLPHFRMKMDAVPGMPTKFWINATKTTAEMRAETKNPNFNYELACTEVCGRGHFSMRMLVVVEEEAEFNKWVAEQKPWLASHQDFITKLPANLQDKARRILGVDESAAPGTASDSTAAAPTASNEGIIKAVSNPTTAPVKSKGSVQ